MPIQPIKQFKFLGYHFTHKSKLLPKSMVNYYEETYSVVNPWSRGIISKISSSFQKFINRLFPNYLVETSWQNNYRVHWDTYEVDAVQYLYESLIKNKKLKGINLSKKEIDKIVKFSNPDDQITYLRKLYDEGRLGKPTKSIIYFDDQY